MFSSEQSSIIQINEHMAPWANAGWELLTTHAFIAPEGHIVHYFYWQAESVQEAATATDSET
jgi:hypothetical protein